MQQIQTLKLKEKAEQLNCSQHNQPIVQLNIEQGTNLGERLVCSRCPSIGCVTVFIDQVEEYLQQWNQQEQEVIENEKQKLEQQTEQVRLNLSLLQKEFTTFVNKVNNQLQIYYDDFLNIIKQQSKLSPILKQLENESIGAQIFQNVAVYLSQQNIQKGKLVQKQFAISNQLKEQMNESIKNISEQLQNINGALKQDQKEKKEKKIQEQKQIKETVLNKNQQQNQYQNQPQKISYYPPQNEQQIMYQSAYNQQYMQNQPAYNQQQTRNQTAYNQNQNPYNYQQKPTYPVPCNQSNQYQSQNAYNNLQQTPSLKPQNNYRNPN